MLRRGTMAPISPLPLPEGFSDAGSYVESLLELVTSSEVLRKLCGGVHILDFLTQEPDLYSAILPLSWREWFATQEIDGILDLLLREDLQLFDDASTSPNSSAHNTRPMSWRGGPLPPESLLDYIKDIRGHCLDRRFQPAGQPDANNMKLPRHIAVGMNAKKVHEVVNFARYVAELTSDLERHEGIEIRQLVDFGSGQNYLGRTLASEPYSMPVVAIESKRFNIDAARFKDVTARLAQKQKIMRNKKEYRRKHSMRPVEPCTLTKPSSGADIDCQPCPPTNPPSPGGDQHCVDRDDARVGRVQYLEHEIKDGDLSYVTDRVIHEPSGPSGLPPSRAQLKFSLDEEHSNMHSKPNLMVVSLHSCGNLVHHGIRSLVLNPRVAAVALVGCCYNLVTERLGAPSFKLPSLRSPNDRLNLTSLACDPHGFPMSARLASYEHKHGTGIRLNITARMMAVQAPYNWTPIESDGFFTRHYFRALLQRVFVDLGLVSTPATGDAFSGGSPRGWTGTGPPVLIGSLRKACYSSFKAYVRGAAAKIADTPAGANHICKTLEQLQDHELEEYEKKYYHKKKELSVVWSLMAFSAGVLESLIVVDRWLFLQGCAEVRHSWVESVFDYRQSPRNLVVVGIKH